MLQTLKNEKTVARAIFFTLVFLFAAAIGIRQLSATGQLIASDGRGYFAHLPSILLDGNIDYRNEMSRLGLPIRNQWSIGTALSWLPFYLLGHTFTRVGVLLGQPWPLDGMAFPEQLLCCWGTVVYGAAAVALSYRFCCRWFHPYWALLGTTLFFAASNLPYYLSVEPYMSHGLSAFWCALLLFVSIKKESLGPKEWMLTGLIAGMAALTRPQDGLFLAVPFVWHILHRRPWKELLLAVSVTGFLSAALFSIQVGIWKYGLDQQKERAAKGNPGVVVSRASKAHTPPTQVVSGGRMAWTDPGFSRQLWGTSNGLFTWHPIYLLGSLGLLFLLSRKPKLAFTIFTGILLQIYLISVWDGQGQTFGGRMFLGAFSSFNLGLVALLSEYGSRVRRIVSVIGLLCVVQTFFYLVRYRTLIRQGELFPKIGDILSL